jgi:hypothetical protein
MSEETIDTRMGKVEDSIGSILAALQLLTTKIEDKTQDANGFTTPNSAGSGSIPAIPPRRETLAGTTMKKALEEAETFEVERSRNYTFMAGQTAFTKEYQWWNFVAFDRMLDDVKRFLALGQGAKPTHLYLKISNESKNGRASPRRIFYNGLRDKMAHLLANEEGIQHAYEVGFLSKMPSEAEFEQMLEREFMEYAEISVVPITEQECAVHLQSVLNQYGPKIAPKKATDFASFTSHLEQVQDKVATVVRLAENGLYGDQSKISEGKRRSFPLKIPKHLNKQYEGWQTMLQNHMDKIGAAHYWSEIQSRMYDAERGKKPCSIGDYNAALVTMVKESYSKALQYRRWEEALLLDSKSALKKKEDGAQKLSIIARNDEMVLGDEAHFREAFIAAVSGMEEGSPTDSGGIDLCDTCREQSLQVLHDEQHAPGCYAQLFFGKCSTPGCKWSHVKEDLKVLARKTIEGWNKNLLQNK